MELRFALRCTRFRHFKP